MTMLKGLPTMAWVIGATVAVAALTPVVGQVATTPPAPPVVTDTRETSPPGSQPPAVSAAPSPTDTAPAPQAVLVNSATTKLGPTAVDSEGYTLYLSVLDSTDPSRSVCVSAECLQARKPVYLPDGDAKPVAGTGMDQALLGALRRPDNTWQATLGGWPLYRYFKDGAPGDVSGEGLKGTWHAIAPNGKKAIPGSS